MTCRNNNPVWEAIGQLISRHLEAERADYESRPEHDRDGHMYRALLEVDRWATAEREKAERGYNGWANYETWAVALWLDNEEDISTYWRLTAREVARAAVTDPEVTDGWMSAARLARHRLGRRLKDEVEAGAPDLTASLYADLLGAALDEVNWHEVADGYLDDITE